MRWRPGTVSLAALALVWLALTAWARPLTLPDEGRYVGVALEMLHSGDWLVPTLDGLPFFHKPPLFYWITAGSMAVFGIHEWAARAAPILGAWLAAMASFMFVQRWASTRAAWLTLAALLAQPLFFIGGQFANLDMLVAGCITACTVLLAHAALCIEQRLPQRWPLAAAYAFAALGILAKGLIGAVIPALIIAAWLLLRRRWHVLLALVSLPGVLIALAIAAPWFAAMQFRYPEFLDYFFVVQHFKRFAVGGFNNVQPFWFYPAVLALFSLPWLPWLAQRLALRTRAADTSTQGPVPLLMLVWVAMVVLFFSLPKSKLLGYVLPAVPALAFLMADGLLARGPASPRAQRWWWASATLSAVIGLAAVAFFTLNPMHSSRELAAALVAQRGAQEPLFMLQRYDYDLPFYAGPDNPIRVVDEWASPDIQQHDNWRKEFADAAVFAPARAAATLVTPALLPAILCQHAVSWLIGSADVAMAYPFLAQASAAFTLRGTVLWRLNARLPQVASALHCSGTPNDGSPGK